MLNYNKLYDKFELLMNFLIDANAIWGMNQQQTTMLLEEFGFPVKDWSWYDGHIVQMDCTDKTFSMVTYVACARMYSFNSDNFSISVSEVPPLLNQQSKDKHNFEIVEYKMLSLTEVSKEFPDLVNSVVSDEFKLFVDKLNNWQNKFDVDGDRYNVRIYFDDKGKLNEL